MNLLELYIGLCHRQLTEEECLLKLSLARMLAAQANIESRILEIRIKAIDEGNYYIEDGNIMVKDTINDQ